MSIDDMESDILSLYKESSILQRILVWGRPYICPFTPLLRWIQPQASLLDIGCGTGIWMMSAALSRRIRCGMGVDTNNAAIDSARQASARLPASISSEIQFKVTHSIADWPDETYDIVSLIDVLHHVQPDQQSHFLQTSWEKVKPGGRLIYKDMASSPFLFATANRIHDLVLARQIINYMPIDDVKDIIVSSGGKLLQTEKWRIVWYAHELMVFEKPQDVQM